MALKRFRTASASWPPAEVEVLKRLTHPSIVRILDFGRDAHANPFLVTELVESAVVPRSAATPASLDVARWVGLADRLLDALAYASHQGILHGDISPTNIRNRDDGTPVLIDFSCARPQRKDQRPQGQAGASGTAGFMSPEALVAGASAASDLFALGACMFFLWTGHSPDPEGRLAASWLVRQHKDKGPIDARQACLNLPPELADWLTSLLLWDSAERPQSASEALRRLRVVSTSKNDLDLRLSAPQIAGDPLADVFVGRKAERAQIRHWLQTLSKGQCPITAVNVWGLRGSGRRALITSALTAAKAGHDPPLIVSQQSLAANAAPDGEALPWINILSDWEAEAAERPVAVDLSHIPDAPVLCARIAAAAPSGKLLVFLVSEGPVGLPHVADLNVGALGEPELYELLRAATNHPDTQVAEHAKALYRYSAGHAALAIHMVRTIAHASQRGGEFDFDLLEFSDNRSDTISLFAEQLSKLTPLALAHLWRIGTEPTGSGLPVGFIDPLDELQGWCFVEASGLARIASDVHSEALLRLGPVPLPLQSAAELRENISAWTKSDRRWLHWLRRETSPWFPSSDEQDNIARGFFEAGFFQDAANLWLRRSDLRSGQDQLNLAEALLVIGRNHEARAQLSKGKDDDNAIRISRRAWLLSRIDAREPAIALLEAALSRDVWTPLETAQLRARLARVQVSSGNFPAATAIARDILTSSSDTAVRILAGEALVLACAYSGLLTAASEALGVMAEDEGAGAGGLSPRPSLRTSHLRAIVAQLRGDPKGAAIELQATLAARRQSGDRAGLATAQFNLGGALADLGRYREALAVLRQAADELGRVGAIHEQALALFNLGGILGQLGDDDGVALITARLLETEAPDRNAFADYLSADLSRRAGQDLSATIAGFGQAEQSARKAGLFLIAALAAIGGTEAAARRGTIEEASQRLDSVWAAVSKCDHLDVLTENQLFAAARITLSTKAKFLETPSLTRTLFQFAEQAATAERWPTAWRLFALSAALAAIVPDTGTPDRSLQSMGRIAEVRAKAAFQEIAMRTDERHQTGLASDPDARWSTGGWSPTEGGAAVVALAERAERAENQLRRLSRINKRLNSELRLPRVLELIIDTVIELSDAERGFLLLADEQGELTVRVARNIDAERLDGPAFQFSRSIAAEVEKTGTPIVTVDAAGDERFRAAMSVSGLQLRSVLAVPLSIKGRVMGVIYVDNRLRRGAFTDADIASVCDFAEQGAIAIENARLLTELRRREKQIAALNTRLNAELDRTSAEVAIMREEIKETRISGHLRHDYKGIIGRTPKMMDLFQLVDRATETHLPVVIQGESGTGKELIARALHFNGRRRNEPFISENCAAIPESLLESTLFGSVRGAFTGADRDTRGLFSIANRGTLFLDEVGEMSAGMQAKLLRVLQEGELRRIGSERAERIDVRIITATNRNLTRLVEERKFRQDLFFRLSVIVVDLPPLRERPADIPLLTEHFVARFSAPSSPKKIAAGFLSRLMAHRWSGNVRELENEIQRAVAFCDEDTLTANDLSPHLLGTSEPDITGNELAMRPRIENLEQHLIREAMTRHKGNQTKAAQTLGLSRFGLQKKLRRYNLG